MSPSCIPPINDPARSVSRWAAPIVSALLAAFPAFAAEPAQFTWTDAVPGDWSDATKWTNDQNTGTAPSANGLAAYVLEFNADGTYAANQDLSTGFLLNQLRFGGSAVTLNGNGIQFATNGAALPVIEQNGAAEVTVATSVGLLADLTFGGSGSGTVTISGAVGGAGGLTMAGSGILSLTGANTYRGNTTVTSGTLRLAQANSGNDKSVVSIAEGATLALDFTGEDTVASLVVAGNPVPDGAYDADRLSGSHYRHGRDPRDHSAAFVERQPRLPQRRERHAIPGFQPSHRQLFHQRLECGLHNHRDPDRRRRGCEGDRQRQPPWHPEPPALRSP